MQKLRVGLLGATGCVGQNYLKHLLDHPFFELTFLGSSSKNEGLTLEKALRENNRPFSPYLEKARHSPLYHVGDLEKAHQLCDLVFSALDSKLAQDLEPKYAQRGLGVISNASCYRMEKDVPILVPEVNASHLDILPIQQKKRGWSTGFIVTKSNCSLISYLLPLYPLHQLYTLNQILVTTLQSVSGAGYLGLSALESQNNVLPYIPGEEEKSEQEFKKILGRLDEDRLVSNSSFQLSTQCMRVPITRGHLASISVSFVKKPSLLEIKKAWQDFKKPSLCEHLPSAPKQIVFYEDNPFHPQPAVDLSLERSMSAVVGRLRPCSVLDYRFVSLTDNLERGAALAGIYAAELLVQKGLFSQKSHPPLAQTL